MDAAWLAAGHLAAALLMLALAALILWIDAGRRGAWPFVAFLLLRAGTLTMQGLSSFADPPAEIALVNAFPYFDIGLAGALLWFASVYPVRRGALWRSAIGASVALALVVWAFARCLVGCAGAAGPLVALASPSAIVVGATAALLAWSTRALSEGTRRVSARLVAGALAIEASLYAGISVAFLGGATFPWDVVAAVLGVSSLVLVLRGRGLAAFTLLAAAALASGVIGTRFLGDERALLFGAWRLLLPLVLTYALVRHRLLDLDLGVKIAARRATVGAIFAGVFFIVTEGAAYALGMKFGVAAGIVAVGALVPLMGPLRQAAERMTDFLPGEEAAPRDLPIERRRAIYQDFALQAWEDGFLARRERIFLDQLRERLALPPEDVLRLESEASRRDNPRNG